MTTTTCPEATLQKRRATGFRHIAAAVSSDGKRIPGAIAIEIDGVETLHPESVSIPALLKDLAAAGTDVSGASRAFDEWLISQIFANQPANADTKTIAA